MARSTVASRARAPLTRALARPPRRRGAASQPRNGAREWSAELPVAPTLAHVYSECARIWNAIHTDRAAALAAGLPDIILHGTATLALAVSAVLRHLRPDEWSVA